MIGEGSIINNRFRLDRLLGRGGFAQVFLCTDLVLGRYVAIKVLDPSVGDRETFDFLGRFQGEARAVAALEHPNILGVYDYGEVEGTVYLVMPYVDGGTLQERIAGGRTLALPAVADYVRQTAAGLDYAHRRGIVHRDIKPQNLLLRAEDNRLLIADFGVAKVLQGGSAQTQTAAIGTVAYMAPEQFEGRAAPSIDIYALGCVLFQLLTGRVPYGGPATQAMYSHLNAPVPSLQERTEGRLPASFQPVIERALAKRPEARYATAGELAHAFESLLATMTAPPPPAAAATIPSFPTTGGTGHSAGMPTPPPGLPITPTAQQAPTTVSPAPAAQPYPGPQQPVLPATRRWPLFAGIGAAIVVLLIAAVLINTVLPRGGAATATVPAIATAGATATATIAAAASLTVAPSTAPSATATGLAATAGVTAVVPSSSAVAATATPTSRPATATATVAATATLGPPAIEPGPVLRGHTDDVRAVAWLGERDRLISGGGDGTVRLWLTDGTLLNTFSDRTFTVTSLAVSPDRSQIAIGSDDRQVHIWRADGTALRVLSGHTNYVSSVAWSPDGKQVVSGSNDGTAQIWSADGQGSRVLSGHTDVVQSVAWSSTGTIATASWDKTIRLWRADGTLVTTLTNHTDQVFAVSWSPDGQTLASGSRDGIVRLWRSNGTPLATLTEHAGAVSSVAWSPDGALFASGSFDKTARLWSASGQPLGAIAEHTNAVTTVSWGPGNGQLATGSWDDTVRLWRIRR